jgi:arabinose-5-phosphate isomerase
MAHLMERTAGEVASRKPRVIAPDQLAAEALGMMSENKITALFVTDAADRPVGIIRMHDCVRAGLV